MDGFKNLGLSDKVLRALEKKGYKEPTPIQKLTIPLLLKGHKDVIGRAQTGTGKTACFALAILEKIPHKGLQAIILTPTRELALQVSKEIESLADDRFNVLAVYGGASMREQLKSLSKGVHIVVGTPGRVMDLMNRRKLDLSHVSYAVLDEADEMLNMGFLDDITEILSKTNKNKKMLLFSATMPKPILKIAKTFMRDYEVVEVEAPKVKLTKQVYYELRAKDRMEALHRIIDITKDFHGIVFCKTRNMVDEVTNKLINANYPAAGLHGEIGQAQREKILGLFRKRLIKVLIATDVAARGIDVNDLTHVINFSLPQSPESYVHRIGRTGRAGKEGMAITFLIPSERGKLKFIERIVNQQITKAHLPSIDDVIQVKTRALKEKLGKILEDENTKKYDDISTAILKGREPPQVVAALLKYIFKTEVSKQYKQVEKISSAGAEPSQGKSRFNPRNKKRRTGRPSFFGGKQHHRKTKKFAPKGKRN